MKIGTNFFAGQAPRVSPRLLPFKNAQIARNAKLLSADLEAWFDRQLVTLLTKAGVIQSLYLMNGATWLHWTEDVNVARGPIAGDATERIYYTGQLDDPTNPSSLKRPKVTNIDRATVAALHAGVNAGEHPRNWWIAGVPAPAAAPTFAQVVDFAAAQLQLISDGSSLSGWRTQPDTTANIFTQVDGAVGNPASSFKFNYQGALLATSPTAFAHKDLGFGDSGSAVLQFEFNHNVSGLGIRTYWGANDDGSGPMIAIFPNAAANSATVTLVDRNGNNVSVTNNVDIVTGSWYTVRVEIAQVGDDRYSMVVKIYLGASTLKHTSVAVEFDTNGGDVRFSCETNVVQNTFWVDNVYTALANTVDGAVATSYVFTWLNELGEEGPPSPATATLVRSSLETTTINAIADPSGTQIADHGLTNTANGTKRLYRAATGPNGTQYQFVADIDYGVTTYVDEVEEEDLGAVLESTDFDQPPDDLRNIIALPNGIMAGFAKNQVCVTRTFRPHAWPVGFRLTTDYPIVALGAIDTTVVALTKATPYLVNGADPEALSMVRVEINYGCVSKRSVAMVKGLGIVYASPDGLVALGPGSVTLVTDQLLTRKQWQDLVPANILGVSHDDRYFGFHASGGFILDPKPNGLGWVELSFVVTAVFIDPETDTLYMVSDNNDLYSWDKAAGKLAYTWRSKLFQMRQETAFQLAQVDAVDYASLTFKLYGDGVLMHTQVVTSSTPFVLPPAKPDGNLASDFEIELTGTSTVRSVEVAEDVEELG